MPSTPQGNTANRKKKNVCPTMPKPKKEKSHPRSTVSDWHHNLQGSCHFPSPFHSIVIAANSDSVHRSPGVCTKQGRKKTLLHSQLPGHIPSGNSPLGTCPYAPSHPSDAWISRKQNKRQYTMEHLTGTWQVGFTEQSSPGHLVAKDKIISYKTLIKEQNVISILAFSLTHFPAPGTAPLWTALVKQLWPVSPGTTTCLSMPQTQLQAKWLAPRCSISVTGPFTSKADNKVAVWGLSGAAIFCTDALPLPASHTSCFHTPSVQLLLPTILQGQQTPTLQPPLNHPPWSATLQGVALHSAAPSVTLTGTSQQMWDELQQFQLSLVLPQKISCRIK